MMGSRRLGGRRRWGAGRGLRAEDGGRRTEDGGRGRESVVQADEGECGSGGTFAAGGSGAAVDIGLGTQAGGTRSVPATSNEERRGWESVVVEESDVLACGGYLPERCFGGAGEGEAATDWADDVSNSETGSSDAEQAEHCEVGLDVGGVGEVTRDDQADGIDRGPEEGVVAGNCSTPVERERPTTVACGGTSAASGEKRENAPNEAIYERADVKRGGADFVSRAPAHPLRRRLRSIWPISDLSADELVVQPATHPLSPRPRESFLPLCRQCTKR